MYYIYHIPTFVHKDGRIGKIGTSHQPAKRVACQGYTDYSILEEHCCIYEVSKREMELQKQWGYPVDKIPYWKTISHVTKEGCIAGGKAGGKIGGKISGRINADSGQLASISSAGGKASVASPNHVTKHRVKCPYCDKISNPGNYKQYHGNNCKHRPT